MTTLISRSAEQQATTRTGAPIRVLVVEDDDDTCSGVCVRLRHDGYQVFSIGDGQNAVSLVQKIDPDVVLLDLGLPGVDGLAVLQRLRALRADLPVIVVSAWEESRYESKCLESGAGMFLQKPIVGEQLSAAVRSMVC